MLVACLGLMLHGVLWVRRYEYGQCDGSSSFIPGLVERLSRSEL